MNEPTRRTFLAQIGAAAAFPVARSVTPRRGPGLEAMATALAGCSREAALPTAVGFLRDGATWDRVLAATLLAGTREIRPQPMNFRPHALMMAEPAFQLGAATTPERQMLPVLFNLDFVKRVQDGDDGWRLGELDGQTLPSGRRARDGFEGAMTDWAEDDADRAVAGLYAELGHDDLLELVWPFALRDFRYIGHKPIYAAAIHGSLRRVGRAHGLPLVRSLTSGLLDGGGRNREWTATFASNGEIAADLEVDWTAGAPEPERSLELLAEMREVAVADAGPLVAGWLGRGVAAQTIWDGLRLYAAEMLSHQRGLAGVHLTTTVHAFHHIWRATRVERTRRLAILQSASWLPMFRDDFRAREFPCSGPGIDTLRADGEAPPASRALDVAESERDEAAGNVLAVAQGGDVEALAESFRRLVFEKGAESHVYKYSAAMLAEFRHCQPELAPRILAAGACYLPVTGSEDAEVYLRARDALEKG